MAENEDALDRKGKWLITVWETIFNGMRDSPVVAFLVLSLFLNAYQYHMNNKKNDLIIGIVEKQKEEMIIEVRNTVKKELPKELAPTIKKVDSTNKEQEILNKRLDTSLTNFDIVVDKVIKKIKR